MKSILHLSDIHFGRVDPEMVQPLITAVGEMHPNVVVVSGDLTQRALVSQFQEAKAFLDKLPKPQIVVPGNHDVPLWNIFSRFISPLKNYKSIITSDLAPFYVDDEIAVVGINTARSFTTKYGRINRSQVDVIRKRICELPRNLIKIIVTHHPFDLPTNYKNLKQLVGRSNMAMEEFAKCGADVFLAGHLHLVYTGDTTQRYKIENHAALIVQAGTAISTRSRFEPNSFNVLHCEYPDIRVDRYEWQRTSFTFVKTNTDSFRHAPSGWKRLGDT